MTIRKQIEDKDLNYTQDTTDTKTLEIPVNFKESIEYCIWDCLDIAIKEEKKSPNSIGNPEQDYLKGF